MSDNKELERIAKEMKASFFDFKKLVDDYEKRILELDELLSKYENTNTNEDVVSDEMVAEQTTEEIVNDAIAIPTEGEVQETPAVEEAQPEVTEETPTEPTTEEIVNDVMAIPTEGEVQEIPVVEEAQPEVTEEAPAEPVTEETKTEETTTNGDVALAPVTEEVSNQLIPTIPENKEATDDAKTTFKKEYDNADKAILINPEQGNKLRASRGEQTVLAEAKAEAPVEGAPQVATEVEDKKAQAEKMMEEASALNAQGNSEAAADLVNQAIELNNQAQEQGVQLVKA